MEALGLEVGPDVARKRYSKEVVEKRESTTWSNQKEPKDRLWQAQTQIALQQQLIQEQQLRIQCLELKIQNKDLNPQYEKENNRKTPITSNISSPAVYSDLEVWPESTLKSASTVQVHRHMFFTSGQHYWEVYIERMVKGDIVIGVGPRDFLGETLNEASSLWTNGAVGYCANGSILSDGQVVWSCHEFCQGDTVGVFVDMNQRKIRFFKNGNAQIEDNNNEILESTIKLPDQVFSAISYRKNSDRCHIIPNPTRLFEVS